MITNKDAFIKQLWNWDMLKGCFSDKNRPMDVDGLIERRGRCLLLEGKGPGKTLENSLLITIDTLIKTGTFTVIVFWGTPAPDHAPSGDICALQVFGTEGVFKNQRAVMTADLDSLKAWVNAWFFWAESDAITQQRFMHRAQYGQI